MRSAIAYRTGQLPLSPQAVRNAAAGTSNDGDGDRSGLLSRPGLDPVYEAGRVGRLMQVGMSLESHVTRHHFLLIMAGCSPGITTGGAAAGGCWPGRLWPR